MDISLGIITLRHSWSFPFPRHLFSVFELACPRGVSLSLTIQCVLFYMLPLLCGLVAVLAGGRADVRRDGGGQWWEWGLRERNGVYVSQEGVAQLDGCTMRGNEDDDYHIYKGGCIEGVDQSLVT